LNTVKTFAEDFLKIETKLDLLVLNAGIMATPKRELTVQGFEKQLGVNHFGHSYLTNLLKPLMMKQDFAGGSSRECAAFYLSQSSIIFVFLLHGGIQAWCTWVSHTVYGGYYQVLQVLQCLYLQLHPPLHQHP
jgi:NAD(P)-dependent dehydrogenase (short-subunit alcohol dehydrogenase family)